jgi:prepilin-type N-terminal cleavage/methylation domain-containing protein
MRRDTHADGFTLVELLVAMALATIIFGATLTVLSVMLRQGRESDQQSQAQDTARTVIDRLSVNVRNALAAPNAAPATVERIRPYDLIIQTIDARSPVSAGNPMNVTRVRLCLDATNLTNATLRMQTQRWTTVLPPALPTGDACPATGWTETQIVASNLINRRPGRERAMFGCWPADPGTPDGCPTTLGIRSIRTSLVVDTDPVDVRGERELSGTVFLRNANRAPVAAFSVSQASGYVTLNASPSFDPDGENLDYAWFQDDVAIPGGTTARQVIPGLVTGSRPSFKLVVTDRGGLTGQAVRVVTVQ